jgi:hypothetical protein
VKLAGESGLLDLLRDTVTLEGAARAGTSDLAHQLADLHSLQAHVLHDRLLAAGVPSALVGAANQGTTASDSGASDAALAAAERTAVTRADTHAGTTADFGALVLSMLTLRFAAAELLGADGQSNAGQSAAGQSSPPQASPSASPSASSAPTPSPSPSPEAATRDLMLVGAQALTRLEELVYLLQVITPHAAPAEKALADQMTQWLTPVIAHAQLTLGAKNPPAVLGVPHPQPIDDATAQRAALAQATTAAIAATGADLVALARTNLRPALATLPAHLGTLVVWSHRWGAPLTALPGLQSP